MAAILEFINGYKVYIICVSTILYTWSDYVLNFFAGQGDNLSVSSSQLVPMDFHGAMMITLAALGAAGFRHAIQKNTDAIGSVGGA